MLQQLAVGRYIHLLVFLSVGPSNRNAIGLSQKDPMAWPNVVDRVASLDIRCRINAPLARLTPPVNKAVYTPPQSRTGGQERTSE